MNSSEKRFVLILKFAIVFMLLGRSWQHLFWGAPFRIILWNESLLSPIITGIFNIPWQEWASSKSVDHFISIFTKSLGVFYLGVAVLVIKIDHTFSRLKYLLPITSILLFVLAFLYYVEKFFFIGMLIEYASQFCLPIILYIALFKKDFFHRFLLFFKSCVALTFLGHGLFAVGFHPVPGPFIDMVISVFGVSESIATNFLLFMGIIDIIVSVLIFIPDLEIYALTFAAVWGIVTALARIVAHINIDLAALSFHQWLMEVLTRLPHGLLPLALLFYLKHSKSVSKSA